MSPGRSRVDVHMKTDAVIEYQDELELVFGVHADLLRNDLVVFLIFDTRRDREGPCAIQADDRIERRVRKAVE